MKKFFSLFFVFFLTIPFANAKDIVCMIVGVTDGDTVKCLTDSKKLHKVRLSQIDAPEKKQAFGKRSKQHLSDLVMGKDVILKTDGTDYYGRTLAEVFVSGENINKKMVKDGMAWPYRKYMTVQEYLTLENYAKKEKLGLWQEKSPIPPYEYRQRKKQK